MTTQETIAALQASLRASRAESDSRLERLAKIKAILARRPTLHASGCTALEPRADDTECDCDASELEDLLP